MIKYHRYWEEPGQERPVDHCVHMRIWVEGGWNLKLALPNWPVSPWSLKGQKVAEQMGCTSLPLGLKNRKAREKGFLQASQEQTGDSPTSILLAQRARWPHSYKLHPTVECCHSGLHNQRYQQRTENTHNMHQSPSAGRSVRTKRANTQ